MNSADIARVVADAKQYAAGKALLYLPAFKRRPPPSTEFYDEPLVGWKAVQLLEQARVVPPGTFAAYRVGQSTIVDGASWCEVCRDAPVARADGLCIWCSLAPIGRGTAEPSAIRAA